ncbi:MAG TPA: TetR/AcrR family transcriptional regulator [Acidimicrobiia bacterium]|nr:TetR/AcrR family transcriptional regulator [Acidimicrobiia bacterium]
MARAESRIRLPADLRRQQIAVAARHVFATHGLAGAKTREIAQAANVTETILYRHFASKLEIFEAAVLQPVEQLATDLSRLTAAFSGIGPEERLERSIEVQGEIRRVVQEITPLLGLALFAQREAGGEFYRERLAPLFDLAADAISRAMAPRQQQIVEPRVLLLALVGMYLGVSLETVFGEERVDPNRVTEELTYVVAFGLFDGEKKAVSGRAGGTARRRGRSSTGR